MFILQTSQTSQYTVPRGGIFLGKWRSCFTGNSDGKMNVQPACALNTAVVTCSHEPFVKVVNKSDYQSKPRL
jgi:hypothetical protein